MSEKTAAAKHSCPACGGEAEWAAGKQALVCPYCGTSWPAELTVQPDGTTTIVEHDLARTLREIPVEARGFQVERTQVRCQSCQAISLFDPVRVAQSCEFCGASALVPYEETKPAFRPESLLPMKLSEPAVRESIRKWYGSHFFAPSSLGKKAMTDQVNGLYVPYWTFDASAHADWTAESGKYYYETETYRDSQGKSQSRSVRKTRWYPSSGSLDHLFDDELVAATKGVALELLSGVEPFPTQELVPYDPAFLSGWIVERYQLDLIGAAERARAQMNSKLEQLCAHQVPGDTHRNLCVRASYSGKTFKHVLVPIWLLTYTFGRNRYQVVVNGSTGKTAGKYPLSWVKVTLAVLAALICAITVLYLSRD